MTLFRWLDARLWLVPVLAAVAAIAFFVAWRLIGGEWVALSGRTAAQRAQLYGALAGASSGLLGFTLAALSVLVAFGRAAQQRLRIGTSGLVQILLSTSLALLIALAASGISLAVDYTSRPNPACAVLVVSVSLSCLVGLVLSLGAFSLAVIANQRT